jgi:hypothetical protein
MMGDISWQERPVVLACGAEGARLSDCFIEASQNTIYMSAHGR